MSEDMPAFPHSNQFSYEEKDYYSGMTLRDWFAGHSDVPWDAVIETLKLKGVDNPNVGDLFDYRAKLKYMEADAMLKERDNV